MRHAMPGMQRSQRAVWRIMRADAALAIATLGALVCALGTSPGCDGRATPPPPSPAPRDAAPDLRDARAELDGRPLGLSDLAAFRWRKRAGQPAFRLARKAEERGDWAEVVARCEQAVTADAGNLDAAWLEAVGLAKLGRFDEVLAPLQRAAAGDLMKWGQASLELPGMAPFLATPTGQAWRRRVAQDRAQLAEVIARAVPVIADGELYGVEIETGRWYRLTRSTGTVLGALALPAVHRLAYVARFKRKSGHALGVGIVDLAAPATFGAPPLPGSGPIQLAYSAQPPAGPWVGTGAPHAMQWRRFDDDGQLYPLPPHTARPPGPWLDVTGKGAVHLHAMPPNLTADWDEQSLASAIRIPKLSRVISMHSPALIDGNSAAWSPDRLHLAFVVQLDDHCAAGAINTAAVVADASTGGTRELERAAGGIALQWVGDRRLAVAGDRGVSIYSLDDGAAPVEIAGASGLLIPRERPRCAAPEPADDTRDESRDEEPPEAFPGDEPVDAGVVDAR